MASFDLKTGGSRKAAALVLLAAIWLAMLLLGRGVLDQAIYRDLYQGGQPFWTGIARAFTALGEPTPLVIAGCVLALYLWITGQKRFAFNLLLLILLGRGLAEVQKYGIARPRPQLEPHLVRVATPSFPSGHATSSMIFYLVLALALVKDQKWRLVAVGCAIVLSILIGISRVMLGVHWPSDVVAGWSFGLIWVILAYPFARRIRFRFRR